jgi:hypothetical protein
MGDEKERITEEGDGADSYPGLARAADGTEDAEMNIFENEKLNEFFGHMTRIKTVRVPGEGKPKTLDAAIDAAHQQHSANRRWTESGGPLGEIKVWAEGREVMCVLPHLPAQLRHFTFDMPSPEAAVLQLTTQLNGELIVLFNLRLCDVPEAGLTHTEEWPSGEKLSLSVRRDGKGKFHVEVELNPQKHSRIMKARAAGAGVESAAVSGGETGFDAEAEDRDSGLTERTREAQPPRVLTPAGCLAFLKTAFRRDVFSTASAAAVVALLSCVAGLAWSGTMPGMSSVSHAKGQSRHCRLASEVRRAEPVAARAEAAATPEGVNSGPIISVPASPGRSAEKAMSKRERHQRRPQPQPPATRGGGGEVLTTGYRPPSPSDPIPTRPSDLGAHGATNAGVVVWEARRAAKLAAVQNVRVQLGKPEAGRDFTPETLRVSFVNALEHSKLFRVVEDPNPPTPDAVITVRFEPDDTQLGALFMDVRDVKGNFLWQGFTGCQRSADGAEPATCAAASARLVDNFSGAIALAQQSPTRPELIPLSVAGQ